MRIREALIKSARADAERFCLSRKFKKWRNTVCISHFLNCTDVVKDPAFRRRRLIQRFLRGFVQFSECGTGRFPQTRSTRRSRATQTNPGRLCFVYGFGSTIFGIRIGLLRSTQRSSYRRIGKAIHYDLSCQPKSHDEGIPLRNHRRFHMRIY